MAMAPNKKTMAGKSIQLHFDEDQMVKPAISLELSLSPSNEADELAAALSRDESDDVPSMETACELVQTLLDQVAWNDAPPTNEVISKKPMIKESKTTQEYSRQCHVQPKSPNMMALQNTATGSDDPSDLWKTHYNLRCTPSEQQMGNVALAALCARTLETVGKPSRPTKEAKSGGPKESPHPGRKAEGSAPWRRKNSPKRQWLRKKNKKRSPSANSPKQGSNSKEEGAFFGEDNEREDRDDHFTNPSTLDPENREPNRLQMFGSEYARYLSTTALAPKDLTSRGLSTNTRTLKNYRRRNLKKVQCLEEAEQSVLTGAITDLIVTHGDEIPPKGYYRLSQSADGEHFFLRDRKAPVYINVKKETNWDRAAQRPCVTALALIFPERKEFVPPGFSVVRKYNSLPKLNERGPANLNFGGEAVFLCFRRSREGNPITGIIPLHPVKRESIPEGYTVLERTPRNFVASIQTAASQVFLAYRQRLANLELLRPLPLVMSVRSGSKSRRLTAYYCTGGTVVDSRVGRFHIMDRSTHSLLSPSSVSNRLSLIETSRRKTLNSIGENSSSVGSTYSYSAGNSGCPRSSNEVLTSSLLMAHGLGTKGSRSDVSDLEKISIQGDFDSIASSSVVENDASKSVNQSCISLSFTNDDDSFDVTGQPMSPRPNHCIDTSQDKELQRCLEALSFIPVVSTGLDENDPKGMLRFKARVLIIIPVLTACYTRHGGSALLAVEGLTTLLREKFFASDVNMEQDSSSRITLLDVVVQVVCDVATMGAQETHLQACVEFVEAAVKYGCGHLNTRSVGYVLRFYLFVFYFGVSSPCGAWGLVKGRDQYLLDNPRDSGLNYLPGGTPQSATLSLKDLISYSIARLRSLTTADQIAQGDRTNLSRGEDKVEPEVFNILIDELVEEIVDVSVSRVDIANYTQLAMHQIHRSGGSELFWSDMLNCCGTGLFGNDLALRKETRNMYSMCFALLANCVKVASSKMRKDRNSEGIPRDVASKLMSLEMLYFFLEKWEENSDFMHVQESRSFVTFAFCVRRLVVPCLLSNTKETLDDPRVYRRVIRIVGILLCSPIYRVHMKLELGILMEHFVIKILRLGPQILHKKPKGEGDKTYLFAQQIELMKELKKWFGDEPRGLLELFLNFDTESGTQQVGGTKELLSGIQWKISQQICASLCSLSEKCGEFIAEQIRESQSMKAMTSPKAGMEVDEILEGVSGMTLARESAQRLRKAAVDAISQIVQCLALSAASARGHQLGALVKSWNTNKTNIAIARDFSRNGDSSSREFSYDGSSSSSRTSIVSEGDREDRRHPSILGYWQKAIAKRADETKKGNNSEEETGDTGGAVSPVYSGYQRSEEKGGTSVKIDHLGIAFEIAREKGLNKAIDYLIACNILTPSPRDIASFLRIHRAELRPADLGKYLGEGGTDRSETEYWNLIRFSYIRAISFEGMTVEQGLRHLLTNGGFRLPGEAQQVDRLITTFAQCFWEDNAGDSTNCPFEDQDTVFLLSFAIIMLNTDLHRSVPASKAGTKKHQHKRMTKSEFLNNLSGVTHAEELNSTYLSSIYDSIESRPIVLHDEDIDGSQFSTEAHLVATLSSMVDNAKSVDALLRGLSIHEYRFVTLNDYSHQFKDIPWDASSDLARKFMVATWHQFHGLINAALAIAHLDLKGMGSCVSLLKYSLCLTICLDMPMERTAFMGQLGRFRLFNAWRRGEAAGLTSDHESYKQEEWYKNIEEASSKSKNDKGKLFSLVKLNDLVNNLGLNIAVDVEGRKAMSDSVNQIYNAEYLLNDPTRNFLRQGDLIKRANRSGRCTEYRFFLFSDTLIYAKKISNSNQYKIHEELPLILMKVVDWFPPEMKKETKRAFQIYHPRKKFMVFCSSNNDRKSWVTDIRFAIDKELERKVAIEAARTAAKSH